MSTKFQPSIGLPLEGKLSALSSKEMQDTRGGAEGVIPFFYKGWQNAFTYKTSLDVFHKSGARFDPMGTYPDNPISSSLNAPYSYINIPNSYAFSHKDNPRIRIHAKPGEEKPLSIKLTSFYGSFEFSYYPTGQGVQEIRGMLLCTKEHWGFTGEVIAYPTSGTISIKPQLGGQEPLRVSLDT